VCLISAFFFHGERSRTLLAGGAALGSLGGLELSIREHFAGYKSHTTMLSAAAGVVTMVVLVLVVHPIVLWILLLCGVGVFAVCFWLFREAFKKRSGGVGFR
jgi:Flp pilus assembly protein TadB